MQISYMTKVEAVLQMRQQVYIRQKFNTLQAVVGWQQQNVYWVYEGEFHENQSLQMAPLFTCQEKSECFQRQCFSPECREFRMFAMMYPDDGLPVMEFEKQYSCTCYCLNRPQIKVMLIDKVNGPWCIGSIVSPFFCCKKGIDIVDESGQLRYTVRAECCQLANFCACPCGECQILNFEIYDNSGLQVGTMIKKSQGCLKQCFANTDNFLLNFPLNATPRDKCLLIAGTILTDYTYFEHKNNPNAVDMALA